MSKNFRLYQPSLVTSWLNLSHRVVAIAAVVVGLLPGSLFAQTEWCLWPTQDTCQSQWAQFSGPAFLVQLQSSPPCSILVKPFGRMRCNQIEMADWHWYLDQTEPPGCMTRQQIIDQFALLYRLSVEEFARKQFVANNPTLTPACPTTASYFVAKPGSCSKRAIGWTLPAGGSYVIEYDPTFPWSYYDSLMSSMSGSSMYVTTLPCNEICCRREFKFCYLPSGAVHSTSSWWSPVPGNVCDPTRIAPWNPSPSNCTIPHCSD